MDRNLAACMPHTPGIVTGTGPTDAAVGPAADRSLSGLGQAAWFCVRSQPKHEHIAAAHLKAGGMEVFLPRIRFKRSTRRGPVWFIEALFPSYLFARFVLSAGLRTLEHARGVKGVVHFGAQWPAIPDAVIEDLRHSVGLEEVHIIQDDFVPGEPVQVSGGAFHGLQAVVMRVMPSRERVAVLLDFLGRQTTVELATESVVRQGDDRRRIVG